MLDINRNCACDSVMERGRAPARKELVGSSQYAMSRNVSLGRLKCTYAKAITTYGIDR